MFNVTIAIVRSQSVYQELFRFIDAPGCIAPDGAIRGTKLVGPRIAQRMMFRHYRRVLEKRASRKIISLKRSRTSSDVIRAASVFGSSIDIRWARTEDDKGVFTLQGGPWEVREVQMPKDEIASGIGLRARDYLGSWFLVWPAFEAPAPLGPKVQGDWESASPSLTWF